MLNERLGRPAQPVLICVVGQYCQDQLPAAIHIQVQHVRVDRNAHWKFFNPRLKMVMLHVLKAQTQRGNSLAWLDGSNCSNYWKNQSQTTIGSMGESFAPRVVVLVGSGIGAVLAFVGTAPTIGPYPQTASAQR